MKLISIAAIGKNRQLGLDGRLPWEIPEEHEMYQQTVKGHHLIIGRKNFEANGGDFKNGTPLILTRNHNYSAPNRKIFHDIEECIGFLKDKGVAQAFVVGGAEIYKLAMPWIDEIFLSVVDYNGEADVYFPDWLGYEWICAEKKEFKRFTYSRLIKR